MAGKETLFRGGQSGKPTKSGPKTRAGLLKRAAKFLISRLNERNYKQYGVSKIDLNRLRSVANGERV